MRIVRACQASAAADDRHLPARRDGGHNSIGSALEVGALPPALLSPDQPLAGDARQWGRRIVKRSARSGANPFVFPILSAYRAIRPVIACTWEGNAFEALFEIEGMGWGEATQWVPTRLGAGPGPFCLFAWGGSTTYQDKERRPASSPHRPACSAARRYLTLPRERPVRSTTSTIG